MTVIESTEEFRRRFQLTTFAIAPPWEKLMINFLRRRRGLPPIDGKEARAAWRAHARR